MMAKDLRAEFKTKQFQDMLKETLGTNCANCGSNKHIHYHHIIPLINGGTNNLGNIVPLCEDCHGLAHERSSYKLLRAGKERAKTKKGYKEGRPKKYSEQELKEAMKLKSEGFSYNQITKETGISKSTLIRYNRKTRIAPTS